AKRAHFGFCLGKVSCKEGNIGFDRAVFHWLSHRAGIGFLKQQQNAISSLKLFPERVCEGESIRALWI
ncbi:hypothetical protein ACQP3D_27125, partial [Escherichia coli]